MEAIKDLDILRPPKNIVKLDGKEIDVSFIPCGITFEVDDLLEQINKAANDQAALLADPSILKKVFDLSIELCALFCSVKNPKLNLEWFKKECNPVQIKALVDEIKKALEHSYDGVKQYGKNE